MSIVELNQLSKCYEGLTVVNKLNLNLEKGEVLGLFGHNGAGKTTTMKMILGLIEPSSGEVRVFGNNPFDTSFGHHRFRLGFLPENVAFYQQLTGLEVLKFFARLKKVSTRRCSELLQQVGLDPAAHRKVKTYSKGMRQRLGLAQALLTEPSLLLLDEPTVGLDPIATQQFYVIVDELKHKGCSIMLCSHVLPGVEKHIDTAAILAQGSLRAYGSLDELRQGTSLKTGIRVTGCFEMEQLAKQLGCSVKAREDGSLEINVEANRKLEVMKRLMDQPGLKDINTAPPSLEQLYGYYIEDQDSNMMEYAVHKRSSGIEVGGAS